MSHEPSDDRYSIASSLYSQSQETYETHEDTSHLTRMSRIADNLQPSAPAPRPPLIPRRSSQRVTDVRPVSAAPPSTFPSMREKSRARQSLPLMQVQTDMSARSSGSSSPVPPAAVHARRQSTLDTPDTPVAGPSSHLLTQTRTSTPSTSSPSPSPHFFSRPIPDDNMQTPRSSVPLMNNPYGVPSPGPFRPLSSVSYSRKGFAGTGYARESMQPAQPHPQSQRAPPQPAFVLPPGTESAYSTLRSKSALDLNEVDLDRYYGTLPDGHRSIHRFASTYSFDPDPKSWGTKHLAVNDPEPDDDLHNPDPRRDRKNDQHVSLSLRGLVNVGCLFILVLCVVTLFAVYPIITYFLKSQPSTLGGYNLGGINASGQVPDMLGNRALVDPATPKEAYTRTSLVDGSTYDLVFSDEFNVDGRSFYPGDDPYWEAVDMHYWSTNNLEWYDPSQVTTTGGSLKIELAAHPEHALNYTGGMLSSWNKFCFTGGYIEANVSLPGSSTTYGLWPAVWTMGNLGRAGYGASLEGTWPYTYDSCDVGTLANQTDPNTNLPAAAHVGGVASVKGEMSYLPGQRLSACTCTSESDGTDGQQMVHPGPKKSDGSYVGRSAPEIDIFEAQVDKTTLIGGVSQSAQWAPFNAAFVWDNSSANLIIPDPTNSVLNTFVGNEYQQTTSVVTNTNQECYTGGGGCFSTYGYEYSPGADGYIQWVNDAKAVWEIKGAGMGPDSQTLIGQRPVPGEPMYILANLGMSYNFGSIDFKHLVFPAYMLIDYIRVYQPSNARNIGCDPPDFPTAKYIETYIEAYTNPNLTTWVDDYKQRLPKNNLIDTC